MIVLGGINENENNPLPIEIYDTETFDWTPHFTFDKFRHATFMIDKFVFSHGGMEWGRPNECSDQILMFDALELCGSIKK